MKILMVAIHLAMKYAVLPPAGAASVEVSVLGAIVLMHVLMYLTVLLAMVLLHFPVEAAVFASRGIIPMKVLMLSPIFAMEPAMLVALEARTIATSIHLNLMNLGRLARLGPLYPNALGNKAACIFLSLAQSGRFLLRLNRFRSTAGLNLTCQSRRSASSDQECNDGFTHATSPREPNVTPKLTVGN